MKLLVQYYRKMRDTTSSGMGSSAPGSLFGGRSAWRVTIRQLESMVRLSEALAKLYCVDEVSSRLKFNLAILNCTSYMCEFCIIKLVVLVFYLSTTQIMMNFYRLCTRPSCI